MLKRITRHRDDSIALLKAAKDSDEFLRHIRSLIDGEGGQLHDGRECPEFERMDENCFKNLSWKVHGRTLWEAMSDMPPIDACRPGLWLYVTLRAIETKAIESHYLAAAVNGSQDTGLSAIDLALNNPDEEVGNPKAPRWKFYSRLVLRRMFGAISERGAKGVFTEVPFAKIWWQRRIAEDIAKGVDTEGASIPADSMVALFFESKGVYEELTRCMASDLTVIADQPVRDGLMHFFFNAAKHNKSPDNFSTTNANFKVLIKRLGVMLAWRAMGALGALENSGITYGCAAEIGRGEFS